ncbi:MAG: NAD(P)-binding domain-containing protein [Verrucomicrobia bacterium]|nr:NAD(P)-binding domain-containing protein [Verrucomicrobiota bacterium]
MATVAIIGAGPSGLVAAKEALACGLVPIVFETGSKIGGLWKPGQGSTWDGMQTNISHHTNCFSDFQWKKGTPDFPTRDEVYQYLCDYAETFKINHSIQFNTEVRRIQRTQNYWRVEVFSQGETRSMAFDFVLGCSGIFSKAHMPQIPGMQTFPGTVIHSKDYKNPDAFEGKKVVVIGNAFSGCEIAASLAAKADHVVNVQHRPMWILPRYLKKPGDSEEKLPCDLIFYSRAGNARSLGVPVETVNERKNGWFKGLCARQEQLSEDLQVKSPPTDPSFVSISDGYLDMIQSGKIRVKTGTVSRIQDNELVFEDGSKVQADALVMCTGYRADIPYLDNEMKTLIGYAPDDPLQPLLLHKAVFPKGMPGMAFVGLYRGPFFGVMELQARLACMAFAEKIPLPTDDEIEQGILAERQIRETIPRPQFPHGNYVGFCEEYAKMIGALPDFEKLKLENPPLLKKLWDGPFTVASYRLTGFGSYPDLALKTIDRVNEAMQ